MVTRALSCRGALTVHKDLSVNCSESKCTSSRSSENALATHSCIVVCRDRSCEHCAHVQSARWSG